MQTKPKAQYAIDAAGKTLGRVASEAAKALMGKMRPDYTPHIQSDIKVTVTNAARLYSTDRKGKQKVFKRYSGYPGGQKSESLASLNTRKPGEALKRAVKRMLPRNTMLVARMKNLTISQ